MWVKSILNNLLTSTFLSFEQALYDHSGALRTNAFPGGPDEYRYVRFDRDPDNKKFSVDETHAKELEQST